MHSTLWKSSIECRRNMSARMLRSGAQRQRNTQPQDINTISNISISGDTKMESINVKVSDEAKIIFSKYQADNGYGTQDAAMEAILQAMTSQKTKLKPKGKKTKED